MSDTGAAEPSLPLAQQFGEQLRRIRERSGISQEELASRVGTAQSYLSRIENGAANPTFAACAQFADALDADVFLSIRRRRSRVVLRAQLSRIENSAANPTLSACAQLAEALDATASISIRRRGRRGLARWLKIIP